MFNGVVAILMTMFLKFHLKLASENKTTIENLEKKGQEYQSIFDIGKDNNWRQIFGINKWLWPLPMYCESGKPFGDGIYWSTKTGDEIDKAVSPGQSGVSQRQRSNVLSPKTNQQNVVVKYQPGTHSGGAVQPNLRQFNRTQQQ